VLFVFQNGHQYKNKRNKNKLLKIQKFKDFNGNGYLQGVRHAAPYGNILVCYGRQNTKILRFGQNLVSK
jgi:hypothetical protein